MKKLIRTYDQFDVVKVPFPFTDVKTTKIRPALVLSTAKHFNAKVGLSVMAMITSIKADQDFWPSDITIENLEHAGLPAPSIIRFKLFTIDHRLILSLLGTLSEKDEKNVLQKFKDVFNV